MLPTMYNAPTEANQISATDLFKFAAVEVEHEPAPKVLVSARFTVYKYFADNFVLTETRSKTRNVG
jgi:hypothetical protein